MHLKKLTIHILYIFSIIIVISLNASFASAVNITLSWDPNTEPDIAGYKIYYGTASKSYSQKIDVGKVTTYTVTNLTQGLTYYFVTTAYDTARVESVYSNEVSTAISTSKYTLTINKSGTGFGRVTSSPTGVNCGSDCAETYNVGTVVTLTATPDPGSTFTGWSGGRCTGTGQCVLTRSTITTVTANFTKETAYTEVIMDNGNAGTSYTGKWSISSGSNPYGANSLWSRDGATYTWRFSPSKSGVYEVSMWSSTQQSRSTSVPVDVAYQGGTMRAYFNQQIDSGKWHVIGTYSFEAGRSYMIKITAQPYPSSTCADAVKFKLIK